jgi:hypothetical protein
MLFPAASFDPETLAVLTRAFDDAWREVQRTCASAPDETSSAARQELARRILVLASEGERDAERLKRSALHAIEATELWRGH